MSKKKIAVLSPAVQRDTPNRHPDWFEIDWMAGDVLVCAERLKYFSECILLESEDQVPQECHDRIWAMTSAIEAVAKDLQQISKDLDAIVANKPPLGGAGLGDLAAMLKAVTSHVEFFSGRAEREALNSPVHNRIAAADWAICKLSDWMDDHANKLQAIAAKYEPQAEAAITH